MAPVDAEADATHCDINAARGFVESVSNAIPTHSSIPNRAHSSNKTSRLSARNCPCQTGTGSFCTAPYTDTFVISQYFCFVDKGITRHCEAVALAAMPNSPPNTEVSPDLPNLKVSTVTKPPAASRLWRIRPSHALTPLMTDNCVTWKLVPGFSACSMVRCASASKVEPIS